MEAVKQRLTQFARSQYDMGQTRFEDYCEINRGTINSIKKQGPSALVLQKISIKCPELNLDWLLTGRGVMLKGEESVEPSSGLPILPFSAVAGHLAENIPSSFTEMEHCYVPDFSARGADYAIRVDGDSMYPRYHNGEILAIKVIKDPTFFQWGKVYVLATNQGCVIKKLFPDPEDKDGIICHSENSVNYPDYKITKADIFNVAIVVGHIGLE